MTLDQEMYAEEILLYLDEIPEKDHSAWIESETYCIEYPNRTASLTSILRSDF